jgi:hypothetical protein
MKRFGPYFFLNFKYSKKRYVGDLKNLKITKMAFGLVNAPSPNMGFA